MITIVKPLFTDFPALGGFDSGKIALEQSTGNEYIWDGTAWQEYRMRYKDLGLVIDATNVAVGAAVYGPVIDNAHQYNGLIITYKQTGNTGTSAVSQYIHTVPSNDTLLGGIDFVANGATQASSPNDSWLQGTFPRGSTVFPFGKKIRVAIRNNTGNTSTFSTLKVLVELVNNNK